METVKRETERSHSSIKLQAVDVEFSEEAVTDYQHRDKQKEINVLEWIAKVILEPLQVSGFIGFMIFGIFFFLGSKN